MRSPTISRARSQADFLIGTSRSFYSMAAALLMWARRGTLPPIISLEGDPLHQLLHVRGPFWQRKRDRGWFPCAPSRPNLRTAFPRPPADLRRLSLALPLTFDGLPSPSR